MKLTFVIGLIAGMIIAPAHGGPAQAEFSYPSDIVVAGRIIEHDNGGAFCIVYARTFIQYKSYPARVPGCPYPRVVTFAGWRISKTAPGAIVPCYTHERCVTNSLGNEETARWYPGQRLSVSETTVIGQDIKDQTRRCPAGGGRPLPTDLILGILATDPCDTDAQCIRGGFRRQFSVYGFDQDDPDGGGPVPSQAVTAELPCGLPYKLLPLQFVDETAKSHGLRTRLFKAIVYEQWLELYWRHDSSSGRYYSPLLTTFPVFSSVPALLRLDDVHFDRHFRGGGTLRGAQVVGGARGAIRVLLEGNYIIDGGLSGDGLIYVKGNLVVRGPLQFRGGLFVEGLLSLIPEQTMPPEPPDRRAAPD